MGLFEINQRLSEVWRAETISLYQSSSLISVSNHKIYIQTHLTKAKTNQHFVFIFSWKYCIWLSSKRFPFSSGWLSTYSVYHEIFRIVLVGIHNMLHSNNSLCFTSFNLKMRMFLHIIILYSWHLIKANICVIWYLEKAFTFFTRIPNK